MQNAKILKNVNIKGIEMNKQELQNEINKTKEHLANMEKMLAECEYERWKPKEEEKYWYITNTNQIIQTEYTSVGSYKYNYEDDVQRVLVYNCFKTKEQAEQEAEKILVRRMLEDIARRLNKGEKIDWNNQQQGKYSLYLSSNRNAIEWYSEIYRKVQGTVYCLDSNFYDVAIQEIGEERLKKYLRGE